jgi:hypothetical protein
VFPVKQKNPNRDVRSHEAAIRFEWWGLSTLATRDLRPAQLRDWIVHSLPVKEAVCTRMVWLSFVGTPQIP